MRLLLSGGTITFTNGRCRVIGSGGICARTSNSLTTYGQSEETGKITATANDGVWAGICGNHWEIGGCKTITINSRT